MDISAIIKAVLAPQGDRTAGSLTDLKPGDQLMGRVLKLESDGRVLMDLGARRVLAQVGFPVKTGQALKLQVVESGAMLHLRVDTSQAGPKAPPPLPATDFFQILSTKERIKFVNTVDRLMENAHRFGIKDALPKALQNVLGQIKGVFETVPMDRSTEQTCQWLKNVVENSGVLFEKQLAEIASQTHRAENPGHEADPKIPAAKFLIARNTKAQLIQIRNYLNAFDSQDPQTELRASKELTFLRRSVDRMLGHIEQQQERAVVRWSDGDNHQVFVHALPLIDQNKLMRLKVYYPRKDDGNGSDGRHRIALLLNMDKLGDVRVDLSMADRCLQIGFFVGTQGIKQLMDQHIEQVASALNVHFKSIMINVSVSREIIEKFENEDLSVDGSGKINITV